jgi:hypothetical protein
VLGRSGHLGGRLLALRLPTHRDARINPACLQVFDILLRGIAAIDKKRLMESVVGSGNSGGCFPEIMAA